ncbi:MAG: 2-dehydro-3-deoxyphosphooctonate aldolase [Geminicoccus sp.]|nr:2-dehydro-3-deoxyphosphooctonate aldolase [Geminicoccus sp.]
MAGLGASLAGMLGGAPALGQSSAAAATTAAADVDADVRQRFTRTLKTAQLPGDLAAIGARLGVPMLLRVFKQEREVEVWVQPEDQQTFVLFRIFPICFYSGKLGPKVKEGDMQSPEGFYFIGPAQMRAKSQYHRAIDFAFPNDYDAAQGYTGTELLIHGNCVSSGCYAMTDPFVEQLYELGSATAATAAQGFWIHAFPFHMTAEALAGQQDSSWLGFWQQLKAGYDAFETSRIPPHIRVDGGRYVVASV